jgi:hypothetical protein
VIVEAKIRRRAGTGKDANRREFGRGFVRFREVFGGPTVRADGGKAQQGGIGFAGLRRVVEGSGPAAPATRAASRPVLPELGGLERAEVGLRGLRTGVER